MVLKIRNFLVSLLMIQIGVSFGQDSCAVETKNQYPELIDRVTNIYEEGILVKRYTKIGSNQLKILTWDGCGRLIQKQKSGHYIRKKRKISKFLTTNYHTSSGNIKTKRFVKTKGCWRIKKSWKKEYSEEGKLIKFEK